MSANLNPSPSTTQTARACPDVHDIEPAIHDQANLDRHIDLMQQHLDRLNQYIHELQNHRE